jgi:hypothetical protein
MAHFHYAARTGVETDLRISRLCSIPAETCGNQRVNCAFGKSTLCTNRAELCSSSVRICPKQITTALAQLRAVFGNSLVQWADCEASERRHAVARGTFILLDLVMPQATYAERRAAFGATGIACRGIGETIKPDSLYVPPSYRDAQKA